MTEKIITTPLTDEAIQSLTAGEAVFITGTIYTARDAAHKRMYETILRGDMPPFDFNGAVVYYAGPSPAKTGRVIGSIGPTTSSRMDKYAPLLAKHGLKSMIGKGERSADVINAIKETRGVYFAATGGAAALLSKRVKSARVIAYEELGTEAVRELEVEMFPVIVAVDWLGNCAYK